MIADRTVTTTVFNIQTYCIHDGPGIRVTIFVKGCPLRCIWCANPESNLRRPQLMVYRDRCTGCGRCIQVCPQQAITITEQKDIYKSVTDRHRCMDCGKCVEACSEEARELAGTTTSVVQVLERVKKDRLFLDTSGGGITISGGECLYCPAFTENLLLAAHEEGIHTAVESCCYASQEVVDRVYRHVDLALCDIKHMNAQKHREYTGVSNERILENIRHIYHDLHVPVWIRVPVIPGYNDDEWNIGAIARFVREQLGKDVKICLLPYHRLGESKNESLGKEMNWSMELPSEEHMVHLKRLAEKSGLQVQIGG